MHQSCVCSSMDLRFGRCSQSFARSARPYCGCTQQAARLTSPTCSDLMKRLTRRMTESMDRFAVQTDQFQDPFIGVLSHELRTPLGAVTAGAALLTLPEANPQRRSRDTHHEQRATHGADDRGFPGCDPRPIGWILLGVSP